MMHDRIALIVSVVMVSVCMSAVAGPAPRTKPVKNVVPDLLLPAEEHWNCFEPQQIPDFKIPKRFDPVLGTGMPVKILIWHTIGRNLFGTVTNSTGKDRDDSEREAMFKKGVSAINFFCMRPTEQVPPGGDPSDPTGLPLDSLTKIVIGNGTHDDVFANGWEEGIKWWADNVDGALGPLGASRPGKPAPVFMVNCDYEAAQTHGGDQSSANYLIVADYAMLERTRGYVAQMYLGPLNTLGHAPDSMYEGGDKTMAWFATTDDEVPERYRGKSIHGNSRFVACFEIVHSYESLLPEGHLTFDQHGDPFVTISHYGREPNVEHWAARVGGVTEVSHMHAKEGGHKLYPMLKTVLERFGAYTFSPERGQSDGTQRHIKEFGRYAITLPGPDGKDFQSTIGSEVMPCFETEAQMLLACFSGADGITYWGSAFRNDVVPRPREGNPQRGQRHDDPDSGNLDLESMNYVLKAFWRMSAKATLSNNRKLCFYDICDGTEEYLNWNTEVSYDGGKTFQKLRAVDWQYDQRTAVRAVVNRKKKAIFILAFQPYGAEQDKVVVRYTEHGAKFQQTLAVPPRKAMIYAFDLPGVKSEGNARK